MADGISLVVAVTDGDWFEHLRHKSHLEEVNFWAPSGKTIFRALDSGELFLFKLHAPRNYIVGGGIFAYANSMPCSLAWEAFGEANGADSFQKMRARIARYRKVQLTTSEDFSVGCRILTQPFFFEERDWIAVPPSWSNNIVTFKTYTTEEADGRALWDQVQDRREAIDQPQVGMADPGRRFGQPVLIKPRLGQGAFRVLVTDIYSRKCAVTGEKTLPALEAAHIKPFSEGGEHVPTNGLLMRRDIHALFDAGYVTVTPERRFEVSRRIRDEFDNGREYYALHGRALAEPTRSAYVPDRDALVWHNDYRFRAA